MAVLGSIRGRGVVIEDWREGGDGGCEVEVGDWFEVMLIAERGWGRKRVRRIGIEKED